MTSTGRHAWTEVARALCIAAGLGLADLVAGPAARAQAGAAWRMTARLAIAGASVVAVAPDGALGAALVSRPASVVWIDLPSGRIAGRVRLPAPPRYATFAGDGHSLVVTYADCAFGPEPCGDATTASIVAAGGRAVRTVAVGSGAGVVAPVGGGPDVLVAASGAGTLDVLDSATGQVVRSFDVGSGVLNGVAVDATQGLAAVADATAGTVTFVNLTAGTVGPVGQVSYEIGGIAFHTGQPYLFAGQAQGEVVDILHTTDGSRPSDIGAVNGVGPLVYLPREGVLAAGGLRDQTVAIIAIQAPAARDGQSAFGGVAQVPIGPPAAGAVGALVPALADRALLAAAPHGLAVLTAPRFAVAQRFLPGALGGVPTQVATGDGATALVVAGTSVDVLAGPTVAAVHG